MPRHTRLLQLSVAALAITGFIAGALAAAETNKPAGQTRVSLAEARRMTRMMDDIYLTAVITTHRMYAHEAGTAAAVAWGKQVIRQVNRKGWPQARIFAASERMLNPENQPETPFERKAVLAFKAGKKNFEQTEAGTYRYATAIPVTEASCLNCHVRNKEGDLLGGVSYTQALLPQR